DRGGRMSAKVEGVANATQQLYRAAATIAAAALAGQQGAAAAVADEWRDLAPVDTGAYRDSIQSDQDSAYSDIDYAIYVEFGTSERPAQPAASEAAARVQNRVGDLVAAPIRKAL
ncbi:MAG: HK97 gp10 family phage protein, partial [Vicinamibacterales bacterium]